MMVIVTYDVETKTPEGRRRLRRVARVCMSRGQRVQNSVFECLVDYSEYVKMKMELSEIIDCQKDSIRFYMTGNNWRGKIEKIGADASYDPEGELIL